MADNADGDDSFVDSVKDKIDEKFHGDDSSSSSSDSGGKDKDKGKKKKYKKFPVAPAKSQGWREKPVHDLLGGGKPADIFLWRNKKNSASVLGFATLVWALFEWIEYHLLSLLCHLLILVLGIHFLWSNTFNLIYRCPQFPEVAIHEDTALQVASAIRVEINTALVVLRQVTSGKDLKKFLAVIASLWILSIAGSWCNLLTLVYICKDKDLFSNSFLIMGFVILTKSTGFLLLHTVPLLYERHKGAADMLLEKAEAEFKKRYEVFHAKVLSKVPRGPSKDKKLA